jgi:HEAT repeat protein
MNGRERVRWYLSGLVTLVLLSQTGFSEPSAVDSESIRAELAGRYYSEDTAEQFVEKHGKNAIPILLGMLVEDTTPYLKAKACFFLGKTKDPAVVEPMIELIKRTAQEVIGDQERHVLSFAMDGLGFTGDSRALEFLKRLASKEPWGDLAYGTRGLAKGLKARSAHIRRLRARAIRGLAASGSPKGIVILLELREGTAKDLANVINGWLPEANARVRGERIETNVVPALGQSQ